VDASNCVVPLPRVGINLMLNSEYFDSVTWKGCGPHECFPVSTETQTVVPRHLFEVVPCRCIGS
jgi:hypothetical protein